MYALTALLMAGGGFSPSLQAEVRLPKVFASHMVLQREKPLVIWGWADPNETIKVQLASERCEVRANDRGEWKAVLPAIATRECGGNDTTGGCLADFRGCDGISLELLSGFRDAVLDPAGSIY